MNHVSSVAAGFSIGVVITAALADARALCRRRASKAVIVRLANPRSHPTASRPPMAPLSGGLCPKGHVPACFVAYLEASAVATDPERCWWALVSATAVGLALSWMVGGIALMSLVCLCVVLGALAALDFGRHRGDRMVEDELPASLDAISNGLRSGLSLSGAIDEAAVRVRGPAGRDLELVGAVSAASGVASGLEQWRHRRSTSAVRLAVGALSLASELGGASQPIDGVAATLRDRRATEREARALSAQARASAFVIICAPLVFLCATGLGDSTVFSFFVNSAAGLLCLAGGVLADGIGALWMLRIVRAQ